MQQFQSRMSYLRNAELLFSLALPALFFLNWQKSAAPVAWELRGAALALISYILLQGALYWHLKLHTVLRRQSFPAYFQPLFRFFQYSNLVAIIAVTVLAATMRGNSASTADLAWTMGLLGFAVLEQINYYHFQLMYDTRAAFAYLRRNGRLRKAALRLDLERSKAS